MDKNGAVSKAAPFFYRTLASADSFPQEKRLLLGPRQKFFHFAQHLQGARQKESAPVRGKKALEREKSRMGHGNSPYES